MSTNSTIGIQNPDGTIRSVYCHWDGYYGYNGRILFENYTTAEKVNELIDHGSISSLGCEIGYKHDFDMRVPVNDKHQAVMCKFYHRDRGDWEFWYPSKVVGRNMFIDIGAGPYYYLFVDGVWKTYTYKDGWNDLSHIIHINRKH